MPFIPLGKERPGQFHLRRNPRQAVLGQDSSDVPQALNIKFGEPSAGHFLSILISGEVFNLAPGRPQICRRE
jgi:hypothetical protein